MSTAREQIEQTATEYGWNAAIWEADKYISPALWGQVEFTKGELTMWVKFSKTGSVVSGSYNWYSRHSGDLPKRGTAAEIIRLMQRNGK